MEKNQIIDNLIKKAEEDIKTATDLFQLKHYDWSLFIWHLALEKRLKALLLVQNQTIIYTHDLSRLAKKAKMNLTAEEIKQLNEITTFNIEARYDDYKLSFYKKATKEYVEKWLKISESLFRKVEKSL